jgi:hypothetical protein
LDEILSDDLTPLDRAIDEAARRLTSGRPSADFRARVQTRLGDRRPPMVWPWRLGVPAAVATALALAVVTHRPVRSPAPPRSARVESASGVTTPPTAAPVAANSQTTPRTHAQGASPSHPPQTESPVSEAELAWRAQAVPALVVPETVTLATIQPEPLEIRPLVTRELTVPAMDADIDKR